MVILILVFVFNALIKKNDENKTEEYIFDDGCTVYLEHVYIHTGASL